MHDRILEKLGLAVTESRASDLPEIREAASSESARYFQVRDQASAAASTNDTM